MNRRMLTLTATLSAALCLMPASLAVAGEDDPDPPPPPPAEQPAPQPVPVVPQPAPEPAPQPAPAPAPAPAPSPAPAPAPKAKAKPKPAPRTVHHQQRQSGSSEKSAPVTHTTLQPVATPVQVSTVPVGSVQAGGGATAEAPSLAGLLGLGAGLVLVATAGGGLALRGRREQG